MVKLSLILPVHNEADGIVKNLSAVIRVIDGIGTSTEIICVENGSTDRTYQLINQLSKKDPRIKLIRSECGWGNAVRAGIKKASGKLICYMVSDGQIDPATISSLYQKYLENQDPEVQLWKIRRSNRENPTRLVNSRIYNFLTRIVFGIDSGDINATPKLIRADLLKSIPLTSPNIALDLELMLYLKKHRLKWVELAVVSRQRENGRSTTKPKTVLEMIKWMVKLYFR
jgi:glycosyltransferase involved in cell wall biosynthesis